jgi:hypothetical protein
MKGKKRSLLRLTQALLTKYFIAHIKCRRDQVHATDWLIYPLGNVELIAFYARSIVQVKV